jgi:N-dimethylarginine dimethylaminohydrolase
MRRASISLAHVDSLVRPANCKDASEEMNIRAPLAATPKPRYLMCPPRYFAVTYSINPWMDPQAWTRSGGALHAFAVRQWDGLHRTLIDHGAAIEQIEPAAGLPDLVFTANAAVVLDGKALLARFRHPERQPEQPVYAAGFRALMARGLIDELVETPPDTALEGAGDCIFDPRRGLFWMGCGFRSDRAASAVVERTFGVPCVPLELANPRFYHLDTAFCALPCGSVVYHRGAFTAKARAAIEAEVGRAERIALDAADAARFAANAVGFGRTLVLSSCGAALRRTLEERGYTVVQTPLDAFLRSGGSACCLTLRLDHRSKAAALPRQPEALAEKASLDG